MFGALGVSARMWVVFALDDGARLFGLGCLCLLPPITEATRCAFSAPYCRIDTIITLALICGPDSRTILGEAAASLTEP